MKKLLVISALFTSVLMVATPALAQSVTTQDISAQLQASLKASASVLVYFDFDSDKLTPETRTILDQQAVWLNSNTEAKVDLAGHTDAVGSNEYNDDLAMRRARSVERYLLSQGVRAAQMRSVVSRGKNELAVTTPKRERLNRRVSTSVTGLVEIVVAPPPRPLAPPVVTPPARRTYAEVRPPSCEGSSRTSLSSITNANTLKGELSTRLNRAISVYETASTVSSEAPDFNVAAYAKMECGIAIGYTKKSIIDERSVSNCSCYSSLLSANDM